MCRPSPSPTPTPPHTTASGLCAWAYTSYSLSEGGQTLVDMAGPTWEALVNIATQVGG
jgi:hypothetical protein